MIFWVIYTLTWINETWKVYLKINTGLVKGKVKYYFTLYTFSMPLETRLMDEQGVWHTIVKILLNGNCINLCLIKILIENKWRICLNV